MHLERNATWGFAFGDRCFGPFCDSLRDLETTEASMKSLHNAISMLRKCLGAEYVPEAAKGSRYRLSPKIRSD
ncbi:MAG: hypothetical protein M0008_07790 [Actinomycetota bacterium]|jgi:hypothetical protein|nr:hypothetical protein [Actinomycetota bacterium]